MKRPNPFDDDDDQPLLPPPASKVLTTKKRNPFEDDSEEEVVKPVKGSKVAGIKNSSKVDGNNIEDQEEEDDDVDPLDAFMAGIKEQPPTASIASSSNQPQIHHKRDDFEEEGELELDLVNCSLAKPLFQKTTLNRTLTISRPKELLLALEKRVVMTKITIRMKRFTQLREPLMQRLMLQVVVGASLTRTMIMVSYSI